MQLWEHQKQAVTEAEKHIKAKGFYFLNMEAGTGKTAVTITLLRDIYRRDSSTLTLILCPKIVIQNWYDEFGIWSKMQDLVQPLHGSTAKKKAQIAKGMENGKRVFITNFESSFREGFLVTGEKRYAKPLYRFDALVIDEIHRLKNPQSKSFGAARAIAQTARNFRVGLTGTMVLNSYADVYSQVTVLDGGTTFTPNYYAFRNRYMYNANANSPQTVSWPDWRMLPNAVPEIKEKLAPFVFRVAKSQCLDLPPLVSKTIGFDMKGDQKKAYTQISKDLVTSLRNKDLTVDIAVTKTLRLLQIAAGLFPSDEEEQADLLKTNRTDALLDIIESHGDEQVIVWCTWRRLYNHLRIKIEETGRNVGFLIGGMSDRQQQDTLGAFRNGKSRVLICHPASAGTGVNLTEASVAVWYAYTFNLEHRLQGRARNYRGGSDRHKKITEYNLAARVAGQWGIDDVCLKALESKEGMEKNLLEFLRREFR